MRDDVALQAIVDSAETYSPNPLQGEPPLRIINLPSWYGRPVPERRWMVRDWMPWGYVTALYGDGGAGKSLLAQQLMTACVIGQNWLGLETTACSAIGLFCEDDEGELLRRQDCINRAVGVDFRDLRRLHIIPRVGDDNVLMTFNRDGRGELTALWHTFVDEARRRGARLAVIDTAADTFGGDEIRRSEVRQFIASCLGRLAREIDGAVLLLAHPSLSGIASGSGSGGSTAWSNSVRSRLYLERPAAEEGENPDNDARILTTKKANYAATGAEIRLRWQDGMFVPVGMPTGGFVEAIDQVNRDRTAEEAFLACLDAAHAAGRYASATANSPCYAPKMFLAMDARRGFNKRQLQRAMEGLFSTGRIRVEPVKTGHRNTVQAIAKVAKQ
ncbi:MAG: AAA family ATPase [Rhodospirillales bacterium]|nr:AAA family ATPase [Rhodospirillales bacterium]